MFAFNKMKNLIPFKKNLKTRANGDFLIVMNAQNSLFYLNATAWFVYENCQSNNTVEDIFKLLIKEFDIPVDMEEEVKSDIINIIRDFQWQKIIGIKNNI